MDIFAVFKESPFTYLEISRGEVYGNRIVSEKELVGVFKLRSGMTQNNNQELRQSEATLHVHPEDFDGEIVGNGIRKDGIEYSITGMTGGDNFDNGIREHYRLTLERTEYSNGD